MYFETIICNIIISNDSLNVFFNEIIKNNKKYDAIILFWKV